MPGEGAAMHLWDIGFASFYYFSIYYWILQLLRQCGICCVSFYSYKTKFWNDLHRCSQSQNRESQIIPKSLLARKPKGMNRISKMGY